MNGKYRNYVVPDRIVIYAILDKNSRSDGNAFYMNGNDTHKLVKGAFLLTLAGLIGKVLSAGYRIPLQNLTGDVGFYVYQQVYPILGMVMVLALYGFPSAISKLTTEVKAAGEELSVRSFYVPVFFMLLALGTGFFLLLYVSAPTLSHWIGDDELEGVYKVAAFTFFVIPFLAVPRGVFQGLGEMHPTAYSQVSEQLIRVFIIIATAVWFSIYGGNIYIIGKVASLSSISAGLVAFGVLGYYFFKKRPYTKNSYPVRWRFYIKSLLVFGLFFSLNHMILLIIQFADMFTLFPGLLQYGLGKVPAMEAKGIFDRGQPFIQLGTVLGSSFSLALIPRISKERLSKEPVMMSNQIRSALSFSAYIAFGASLGLILIFPEANQLLYKNSTGTGSLRILVIAILLSSLVITGTSVLQGLGYMKTTALFIGIAFLLKWVFNMAFVPLWGITGSALATVLSLLFLASVVFISLNRKLPELAFLQRLNWRALIVSGFGMTIYITIIHYTATLIHLETRLEMLIYVIFTVLTGGLIYLYLLLKCKAFTENELAMLPFAHVFIRLQRGRN